MAKKDKFLQDTLQFWQKRTSRTLTEEDAREISENLFNFVQILLDWHREDSLHQIHELPDEKGVC